MEIENVRHVPAAELAAALRQMPKAELLAQELVQKGAEHALLALAEFGITPETHARMLASLQEHGRQISAEVRRRGLPTVDTLKL